MLVLLLHSQNRARKNRTFYFSFLPFQPGLHGRPKEYCSGLISFKEESVRVVCVLWTSLGCTSLTCTGAAWRFLEISVSFLFIYDISPKCPYTLATFVFIRQANYYWVYSLFLRGNVATANLEKVSSLNACLISEEIKINKCISSNEWIDVDLILQKVICKCVFTLRLEMWLCIFCGLPRHL